MIKPSDTVTMSDYLQVTRSERADVIDGQIIRRLPRSTAHKTLVDRLYQALSRWDLNRKFLTVYTATPFGIPDAAQPQALASAFTPDLIGFATLHVNEYKILNPDYRRRLLTIIPRLVVEVPATEDAPDLRQRRLDLYLRAGVGMIWSIEMALRAVVIYRPEHPAVYLPETETLAGGEIMPDFVLPVASLFAEQPMTHA